ncbi:MAG: 23S rRNA (adenine(2503)-C(2))-methyltransferase RlmN [Deltaproteobacteria bacterium]|nr:23S rRNA (adenine(2503)-C(2))-methyltransferase RlmN [Deltaproteobacteria bacterium]
MEPKTDIKSFSETALAEWLSQRGAKPYRTGQILRWVYLRHATSFDQMTDLSKRLRELLSGHLTISRLETARIEQSNDGSRKYLFKLEDGNFIESVLIPEKTHWTLCISSQIGCAQGCRFCLTGKGGFVRNLASAEIINQVWEIQKELKSDMRLSNIVLMGMGEPLANYNNVIAALRILMANNGLQFSSRKMTLSTAGIVPKIEQLGQDITVNLAVSLNAADNKTREYLMPINRQYPIETLIEACKNFPLPPRRIITFEYILMSGVNDSPEDAHRLVKLLRQVKAKINLIPFNAFEESYFKRPTESAILTFQKILIDHHYTTMIRYSKGTDISAACGQLRRKETNTSIEPKLN